MTTYGARFDIDRQPRYDRTQVIIRLALLMILLILFGSIWWAHFVIYLALPVIGAFMISQKGVKQYHAEAEQNMTSWLRYILSFYSYLWMLTDKFPIEDPRKTLQFDVIPSGNPLPEKVLVRIFTGIPHVIILSLLGIVAFMLMVFSSMIVLVNGESYPEGIFNFLRGYVRWLARVYTFMAGLVDEYPPFALDMGHEKWMSEN